MLTDIETAKKNELERRRKLRIQQVRQQSKDIANALREKVRCEKDRQVHKKDQQGHAFLKKWESKRVDDLQRRYRECLEDVGQAHVQAAIQPDVDEFKKKEKEINQACAAIRGQNAMERLHYEQQKCIAKETAILKRKKSIREKEDYRSNLVAALPPPIPIPQTQSHSSSSYGPVIGNSKRCSPFKKNKFNAKPKRRKPRVLLEIPSNLPATAQRENYFISSGTNFRKSNSDDNHEGITNHKVLSVSESCLVKNQDPANHQSQSNNVGESASEHPNLQQQKNCNFNRLSTVNQGGVNNTRSDCRKILRDQNINTLSAYCHKGETGLTGDESCGVKCPNQPVSEFVMRCSCFNAAVANNSPDHKCSGYELHFNNENRSVSNKSPNYGNMRNNGGNNSNKNRRRRYSETDCYSDDSFDSDVTWPPCTPRTRPSRVAVNNNQPLTSRVEYYDHNNRFYSSSCRSQPAPCITRLHHLPNNIASAELERLAVEDKVSKTELFSDKQSKRCIRAVERQRLKDDFQRMIDDLSKLDKKERKLRYLAREPCSNGGAILGEVQRKDVMANRQKKMESAVENVLNSSNKKKIDLLYLNKGASNKNNPVLKKKSIPVADEFPQLNVADWKSHPSEVSPKKKPVQFDTSIRELDGLAKNKLNLQNLMKRINEQREMLFNDIRKDKDKCPKESLPSYDDTSKSSHIHKQKNVICDRVTPSYSDQNSCLNPREEKRTPLPCASHPIQLQDTNNISHSKYYNLPGNGRQSAAINNKLSSSNREQRRSPSPCVSSGTHLQDDEDITDSKHYNSPDNGRMSPRIDEKRIPWSQKISPNAKSTKDDSLEKKQDIHCPIRPGNNTVTEGSCQRSHSSRIESDTFQKYVHTKDNCSHEKEESHSCPIHDNCLCKKSVMSSGQRRATVSTKKDNQDESNSPYKDNLDNPQKKSPCNNDTESHRKEIKKIPCHKNGQMKSEWARNSSSLRSGEAGFCSIHEKCTCKYPDSSSTCTKSMISCQETEPKGKNCSCDKNICRKEKRKPLSYDENTLNKQEKRIPFESCELNQEKIYSNSENSLLQSQDSQNGKKFHCQCREGKWKSSCSCRKCSRHSKTGNGNKNDVDNTDHQTKRFPSPIPHCPPNYETTMNDNKESKIVVKNNIIQDNNKDISVNNDKKSNNSSEESGSTIYSLDMALSQVSMDSSQETSSSSFKGVRIVVKVSGQKQKDVNFKTKKKNLKTQHKDDCIYKKFLMKQKPECKEQEECHKLLEDVNNKKVKHVTSSEQRNQSAASSSTSYLSPPDNLTPKQVDMLSNLFKSIECQDDHKGIPLLKQYILRLLNMSRESVDRLDVSSSDVSVHSSIFQDDFPQDLSSVNKNCEKISGEREESPTTEMTIDAKKSFENNLQNNLDLLRQQVNKYFESKNDCKMKAASETNDIVNKYAELAKMYADRINSLAEMIGDLNTSEVIRKPDSCNEDNNETSYLSLPPGTYGRVPIGEVEPCEYISPTFVSSSNDDQCYLNKSWRNQLNSSCTERNDHRCVSLSEISTNILPAPPRSDENQSQSLPPSSVFDSKPPPTILNGKMRMCTPHELSAIQEVDTPTTSRIHLPSQAQGGHHTSTPVRTCHQDNNDEMDGITLSNEKIEDINLSFLTLKSNEEDEESDEEYGSVGSIPDVMEELLRRGIITSPFKWAKNNEQNLSKSESDTDNDDNADDSNNKKKDNRCSFMEDLSSSQMADDEVRDILKESSPEDIETIFDGLGMGWASTTLRKTRQANELSGDSSSSNEYNSSRNKTGRKTTDNSNLRNYCRVGTSTPDHHKSCRAPLIPINEPDISTVKLSSSSSDNLLMLTPPDLSLKTRIQFVTLSDASIGSLS